jgi:hypothetical protein
MGGGISNYHENIVLPLQAATTVFIAAAIIGFIREEATDGNLWQRSGSERTQMTAAAVIGVDDWGLLTRRQKAFVIGFEKFAGMPKASALG